MPNLTFLFLFLGILLNFYGTYVNFSPPHAKTGILLILLSFFLLFLRGILNVFSFLKRLWGLFQRGIQEWSNYEWEATIYLPKITFTKKNILIKPAPKILPKIAVFLALFAFFFLAMFLISTRRLLHEHGGLSMFNIFGGL